MDERDILLAAMQRARRTDITSHNDEEIESVRAKLTDRNVKAKEHLTMTLSIGYGHTSSYARVREI